MARVTLQTIADDVGVSRMTVSNAFSRPDQLSAELRERILDAARRLGYAGPDPSARALAKGTTSAVGVLLTDSLSDAFADEVSTTFLGSIARELTPSGLSLTLLSAAEHQGTVPARDVPMDGAIVYSCSTESDALDWLRRRKVPLVFVDQDPVRGVPCVNIDDRGGARSAAQHVVDLGHRRVAIVSAKLRGPGGVLAGRPAGSTWVTRQRLLGWSEALDAAGIEPTVLNVPYDDDAVDHLGELLGGPERPTAVLCYSDVAASAVVRAAERLHLAVPGDLTVVGFDDNPLASRITPPLTTVRQDLTEKGRAAVELLAEAIDRERSGRSGKARHVVLPTELIVRSSTAAPRP